MAIVTISATAATTVDGRAYTLTGTGQYEVGDIMEFSRDVDDSVALLTDGTNLPFTAIVNTGDENAFVQCRAGSTDFYHFNLPVGAHILLPSAMAKLDGTLVQISSVAVYCATGLTTRVNVVIGINPF
jgi:hypothetical protein